MQGREQWSLRQPHSAGSGHLGTEGRSRRAPTVPFARGLLADHLASHSPQVTTGQVTTAIYQLFSLTHRRPSAITTTREDRGDHKPDATAARPDGGALPGPGRASAWSSVPCEP